jgi:hypothetical protein
VRHHLVVGMLERLVGPSVRGVDDFQRARIAQQFILRSAALLRLDQATQGLDKTLAGLVVDRAGTATASFDPPAGVVGASVAISVAAPAVIALVG